MKKTYLSIPGLEPDAWSNDACRGYVIMAMQYCGFSHEDIHRVVRQLYEVFDIHTINQAEQKYYYGDYWPRAMLARSCPMRTQKCSGDTKPHWRMKWHNRLSSNKIRLHIRTAPEAGLCFFSWCKSWKLRKSKINTAASSYYYRATLQGVGSSLTFRQNQNH